MIKVFIVDDNAIVREALKEIIREIPDMITVGEAANGQHLLDQAHKGDWDVVILDIAMPGKGGLDTLVQLKRERPDFLVLMLSLYPEKQYAVQALRAGASGYLTKVSAPEELVAAIRKVSQGGKYVGASLDASLRTFDKKCHNGVVTGL